MLVKFYQLLRVVLYQPFTTTIHNQIILLAHVDVLVCALLHAHLQYYRKSRLVRRERFIWNSTIELWIFVYSVYFLAYKNYLWWWSTRIHFSWFFMWLSFGLIVFIIVLVFLQMMVFTFVLGGRVGLIFFIYFLRWHWTAFIFCCFWLAFNIVEIFLL